MSDELNNSTEETGRPASKPPQEGRRTVPSAGRWSDVMDELIEEAMRSGAFDDLPGRGKPLNLSNNPYAPGAELAYQLLKDNNYTLPWIAQRQKIQAGTDNLRTEIIRDWHRYQAEFLPARDELIRASLKRGWRERLEAWDEKIATLNKRIAALNLKQPGEGLEILKITLDSELNRAGASRELGQ
jgi:DnaJ family protein C protein 28